MPLLYLGCFAQGSPVRVFCIKPMPAVVFVLFMFIFAEGKRRPFEALRMMMMAEQRSLPFRTFRLVIRSVGAFPHCSSDPFLLCMNFDHMGSGATRKASAAADDYSTVPAIISRQTLETQTSLDSAAQESHRACLSRRVRSGHAQTEVSSVQRWTRRWPSCQSSVRVISAMQDRPHLRASRARDIAHGSGQHSASPAATTCYQYNRHCLRHPTKLTNITLARPRRISA